MKTSVITVSYVLVAVTILCTCIALRCEACGGGKSVTCSHYNFTGGLLGSYTEWNTSSNKKDHECKWATDTGYTWKCAGNCCSSTCAGHCTNI